MRPARRGRGSRGASAVEFALLAPVLFGVIGLSLFTAYAYEQRSHLQRAAERTARYAAVRCDNLATYPAGSTCSATGHRGTAELLAYAATQFDGQPFTLVSGPCALGASSAVLCETLNPATPTTPVANQRLHVTLMYRSTIPMAPFLRAISVTQSIVNLTGRGEATVE